MEPGLSSAPSREGAAAIRPAGRAGIEAAPAKSNARARNALALLDLATPTRLKRIVTHPTFVPDTPLPCVARPSPNHGGRRGRTIDSLVLHYTGMPTAEGALRRLCDPAAEVSSHYLIDETGGLFQLVPESRRAWHAGRSYWRGERDMNSVSIGIEIANAGHDGGLPPFPDAQVATVIALCRDLIRRHSIASHRVLAHSDIAPGRKIDPGERFPWRSLASAGVGALPANDVVAGDLVMAAGAVGYRVAALRDALKMWGFDATSDDTHDRFDAGAQTIVAAFQRRFRPNRVDGIADQETVAKLHDLLAIVSATR